MQELYEFVTFNKMQQFEFVFGAKRKKTSSNKKNSL